MLPKTKLKKDILAGIHLIYGVYFKMLMAYYKKTALYL